MEEDRRSGLMDHFACRHTLGTDITFIQEKLAVGLGYADDILGQ